MEEMTNLLLVTMVLCQMIATLILFLKINEINEMIREVYEAVNTKQCAPNYPDPRGKPDPDHDPNGSHKIKGGQ